MIDATPSPTHGWTIVGHGDGHVFQHGPEAALLLGGQLSNSSSSSPESIAESFRHVGRVGGNLVLSPVSWALTEPVEGGFDFTLVDAMLAEARQNKLSLVLLWFGAFKNAASTYAPRWVRADRSRFPRAVVVSKGVQAFAYSGAMAKPVLSVFSEELRAADTAAFVALMMHLSEVDTTGVVAMIQVENESGLLTDSRDRSALAQQAWSQQVPEALVEVLALDRSAFSPARELWQEHGARMTGAWAELFGSDWRADEVFMAWAFATYVEHVAGRGRAVKDVPMYANAWLGPQPGQDMAGQYPSGGPASRVLDVWRAAAPSLALLGPDIYIDDADGAMREYADGQPLFVPECRLSAAELIRAVGCYGAIGWSGFGIDLANPDGQLAATLGFLTALDKEILAARRTSGVGAVILDEGSESSELRLAGVDIFARGTLALFQRMLLDAGVDVPDPELSLPDETLPGAPVPRPGDPRPFGLVISEPDDSFIVVGQGLTLDFFLPGTQLEIDSVVELLLREGRIHQGRVLNGDERLRILPTDRVGAARVRLIRT